MITFKDIVELRPYCAIYVNNGTDIVNLYEHSDNYIVTDMKTRGGLELLVCPKDSFNLRYNKRGYLSAGVGFEELYEDEDDDDDV